MLAWTPYCPKDKRLSSLDNRVSNLAVISMNFKKIKLPKIKELIGDSSCEISFKNINSFSDKIEEINQVGQLSVHAGRTPVQPAWTYVCPEWIGIQPAWTYVCPLWTYLCPTSNFNETKMCLNFSHQLPCHIQRHCPGSQYSSLFLISQNLILPAMLCISYNKIISSMEGLILSGLRTAGNVHSQLLPVVLGKRFN